MITSKNTKENKEVPKHLTGLGARDFSPTKEEIKKPQTGINELSGGWNSRRK